MHIYIPAFMSEYIHMNSLYIKRVEVFSVKPIPISNVICQNTSKQISLLACVTVHHKIIAQSNVMSSSRPITTNYPHILQIHHLFFNCLPDSHLTHQRFIEQIIIETFNRSIIRFQFSQE